MYKDFWADDDYFDCASFIAPGRMKSEIAFKEDEILYVYDDEE